MSETPVHIDIPESGDLHLRIATGACKVRLAPAPAGAPPEAWVRGTYIDPSGLRPNRVKVEGGTATITPDRPGLGWEITRGVPEYDLQLGRGRPYGLTLELGASDNDIELGGLPLRRVETRMGAGRLVIRFSAPNPEEMSMFALSAGAGSTEVSGLGNADAAEIVVDGGAASFMLRFDGPTRRGGHAKVSTGMASVEIGLPTSTPARVTTGEGILSSVQADPDLVRADGAYWTAAGREGAGPLLTVEANVSLGSLALRTLSAPTPLS